MGLLELLPGIGWLWPRPGRSYQLSVELEEACEWLEDAGCALGSGEDCGEAQRAGTARSFEVQISM